ncbi:MAG: hypothetical protein ACI379_07055 [Nocardioides sp.]|uniref:hypothetical protein n=1 Tax=Nocardioides sp. TaxID=35761 RepID=UPI003F0D57B4
MLVDRIKAVAAHPATLTTVGTVADGAATAWGVRRKPRSSAAVLRRALWMTAATQAGVVAQQVGARAAFGRGELVAPQSNFTPLTGEVPLRVMPTWTSEPRVVVAQGSMVVLAGPEFDLLPPAEQQTQYRRALATHVDTPTLLGLAAVRAGLAYGAHRVLVGTRTELSRGRTAAFAATLVLTEAGLGLGARRLSAARRTKRVRAEADPSGKLL